MQALYPQGPAFERKNRNVSKDFYKVKLSYKMKHSGDQKSKLAPNFLELKAVRNYASIHKVTVLCVGGHVTKGIFFWYRENFLEARGK